ncbi:MAG TPA: putative RNA uridine N3 methyltransferase, partial [Candidatus Hodarchaeales archaeon]|nr:putative RNA uridine N3 methyltransferase [Candidatus Hodarchaeales archaeon]
LIYSSPFIEPKEAERENRIVGNILGYIESPQYLRKDLFPIHRDLEHVGSLPPLATPHHLTEEVLARNGQFREAMICLDHNNDVVADAGLRHPLRVINFPRESLKDRKVRRTIRLLENKEKDRFEAEFVPTEMVESKVYWGFRLKFANAPLGKLADRKKDFFMVATDRNGIRYDQLPEQSGGPPLTSLLNGKGFMFLFGEPKHNLFEMLKGVSNVRINEISDMTVNTVPSSGTRSIRLEEALIVSLARLLPLFGIA